MTIAYPLDTMKRVMQRKAKAMTPRDVLKREKARAQREKLVAKLELQLRAAQLPEWEREYKFHPERGWRFDLAWKVQRTTGDCRLIWLAVEVHGGIWNQGAHVRGKRFLEDREKCNEARLMGWLVLEVCDEHIESGQAIEWIRRALQA